MEQSEVRVRITPDRVYFGSSHVRLDVFAIFPCIQGQDECARLTVFSDKEKQNKRTRGAFSPWGLGGPTSLSHLPALVTDRDSNSNTAVEEEAGSQKVAGKQHLNGERQAKNKFAFFDPDQGKANGFKRKPCPSEQQVAKKPVQKVAG